MKVRFIYNPRSGNNARDPNFRSELERRCKEAGPKVRLAVTKGPGHATELAREALAEGCGRIVAVGGDGTMNETAQALVGQEAALGLVPCGSGNGLALHLGIPTGRAEAIALVLNPAARIQKMDTGFADGRLFCNAMGMGLDAEISLRFNRLTKRGLPAYVRTTLGALFRHRAVEYRLHLPGGNTEILRASILAVANSDQYGNNARIAPRARVDDGLLNLVAIRPVNPLSALDVATRIFSGSLHRSRHVVCLESGSFEIQRPAAGPLHTDGETHQAGERIQVRIRPASLRILVPPRN
jgi:YegS/Rv2252/BmrU family lipid kinase